MPIVSQIEQRRRALGITGKLKKPGVWRDPRFVEKEYEKFLLSMVRDIEESVKTRIVPLLPIWVGENRVDDNFSKQTITHKISRDAFDEELDGIIAGMTADFAEQANNSRPQIVTWGNNAEQFNNQEWHRIINRVASIDLFVQEPWLIPLMDNWVSENVRLVKNLSNKAIDDIEGTVRRGIQAGKRSKTIERELIGTGKLKPVSVEQFESTASVIKKTKNRARLIAVDQIGKLNGKLTERRQVDLGIDKYIWRNMMDRRVRGNPSGLYPNSTFDHWKREGEVFEWSKPPADGHPGQAIRCRCFAEPVFED